VRTYLLPPPLRTNILTLPFRNIPTDKQLSIEDEETGRIRLENGNESENAPRVYDEFVQGGHSVAGDEQGLLSGKERGDEDDEDSYRPARREAGLTVCTCCGIRYVRFVCLWYLKLNKLCSITCFAFWVVFCLAMGLLLVTSALSYAKWTTLVRLSVYSFSHLRR
jgi:hypothetical protein